MEFNYKMIGISLILLSTIVKVEGILSPIEILDRNQFRCGRQQSKELCSKSAIERKRKLKGETNRPLWKGKVAERTS